MATWDDYVGDSGVGGDCVGRGGMGYSGVGSDRVGRGDMGGGCGASGGCGAPPQMQRNCR